MIPRRLVVASWLMASCLAGCRASERAVEHDEAKSSESVNAAADDEAAAEVNGELADVSTIDDRIVTFLKSVQPRGVRLEPIRVVKNYVECRVAEPSSSDDYDVLFSFRSFAETATEAEMREALDVNLAYRLNTKARLAMSHAGFRGRRPGTRGPKTDDELAKIDGVPVSKAVERWFEEYQRD